MKNSVIVDNVIKTYPSGKKDKLTALDHISFEVEKGQLFGLIGPDGAGKSSLFRIMITLLLADSGRVIVEGFDVVKDYMKIRQISGYMPGRFSLYQDLSVEENLEFFATVFNTSVKENYELIRDIYVQLEPFKKRKAGALSGGMKQKLALCCALIHRPQILFLDEPTTGVDAVSRVEFWDMLQKLKLDGITILVSTAYMDEASRCDQIALIHNGRILASDTPEGISGGFGEPLWAIRDADMFGLLLKLRLLKQVNTAYPSGEFHHMTLKPGADINVLVSELEKQGVGQLNYHLAEPDVEDVFMKKMK
ncbi:MAG TPA: ABC transporter ATP-binding protein [Chitinophagaceae bacterium]|nr:ABC transporter ATP-binding protein [Chitinophagaceae bacterium]